jgi:hypothetical protein
MITTMYDAAAIFRREFVARRALLWAALYIAVLVAVVPLAPFISAFERADVRDLMSVGSALGAAVALSIGLGATFFGRDLSEGRLGFYFERPVRSVAVWLGRFLAVVTIVVMFEVLVLLPAGLSSRDGLMIMDYVGWPKSFGAVGWAVLIVAVPAILVLLAHAVSVMVRARTAWLVLDLVGFTGAGIAAWVSLRPLIVGNFRDAVSVVGLALAASALLALLAGFAVGVHSGRCDLGRVHRSLSITLWSVAAITFGGVTAYSAWLGDFEPSELGNFQVVEVASNGTWVEVNGTSPGRLDVERRFLISTKDSRWLRLPRRSYADFSRDGQRALVMALGDRDTPGTVHFVDLDGRDLEPVATSIVVDSDAREYLSPDGRRLAIKDQGMLSVYDLDSERLLTAVRLPDECQNSWPIFIDAATIRLVDRSGASGDWTISIAEVDTESGNFDHTGSIEVDFDSCWFAWDANLRYMAVTTFPESNIYRRIGNIFDARSGEFVRPIVDFAAFLHGGRVLKIIRERHKEISVVVEDTTGENSVELDLPDVWGLEILGEGLPGKLLLAHSVENTGSHLFYNSQVDLFDLETGAIEMVGNGLKRVSRYNWADGSGWFRPEPAGQRLFWKDDRTLVRWDPDSGKLVPVVVGVNGE